MRSAVIAVLSGIALSFSAAALASEAPDTNQSKESSANTVVCRYVAHQGRPMTKPTCATKREWNEWMRSYQHELALYQIRANQSPMGR